MDVQVIIPSGSGFLRIKDLSKLFKKRSPVSWNEVSARSPNLRTTHIKIRYHFSLQAIKPGEVKLIYCPTELTLADALAKALSEIRLTKFATSIVIQDRGLDHSGSVEEQTNPARLVLKPAEASTRFRINPRKQELIQMLWCNSRIIHSNLLWIMTVCSFLFWKRKQSGWISSGRLLDMKMISSNLVPIDIDSAILGRLEKELLHREFPKSQGPLLSSRTLRRLKTHSPVLCNLEREELQLSYSRNVRGLWTLQTRGLSSNITGRTLLSYSFFYACCLRITPCGGTSGIGP